MKTSLSCHLFRLSLVMALLLGLLPMPVEGWGSRQAPQATIVVNSEGDQADPTPDDGTCDIFDPPQGICTLRAAIQTADGSGAPGADTITFAANVSTIKLTDDLPWIRSPVTINGQKRVVLDGNDRDNNFCFVFSGVSGGATVTGMIINNCKYAIWLFGGGPYTIQGNYIGTDRTGTVAKPNKYSIGVDDASHVLIGGTTADERNVISGNIYDGISIDSGSYITITGNYIGVDATGTKALGNGDDGVDVSGLFSWKTTTNVAIGGNTAGARNVIAGNGDDGILVSGQYATSITIQGNYIGTDKDGLKDLGNGGDGVHLMSDSSQNTVGGGSITAGQPCSGACNVISGNEGHGIYISSDNNTVAGNFIGTDVNGTAAIPNSDAGVYTSLAYTTTIRSNLISGNHGNGIRLSGGYNVVRGNFIGTDINGTARLGNGGAGVYNEGDWSVIGGDPGGSLPATCADPCNLISANSSVGITTTAGTGGHTTIIGNFIGADVSGEFPLGNQSHGIAAYEEEDAVISQNLISANGGHGVYLSSGEYTFGYSNTLQANIIGMTDDEDENATYMGNQGYGIFVYRNKNTFIGGEQDGQGNTIALNVRRGVAISSTLSTGNRILRNSIFDNAQMGIDLGEDGVTPNDAGDGDIGPNNLQNYPVITDIQGTQVSGVLTSTANTTFRLEFFANPLCSFSGHGQGKIFLGSLDVTTDAHGRADFQGNLTTAPPSGHVVAATATDPDGNTSEFSACYGGLVVNSVGDKGDKTLGDGLCDTGDTISNGDPECTLRAAIEEANALSGPSTISFDIPGYGTDIPTIWLNSPLPQVNNRVSINGTTQSGGLVHLEGASAGANANGLELRGGKSRVGGLVFCGFDGHGILLAGGDGHVVAGNLIGVDENNNACSIGGNGIRIEDTSDNNVIGGTTEVERNVIANSAFSGIYVMAGSSGNSIRGNYIGTDLSGTTAQGNALAGVHIEGDGNFVGGLVDSWGTCAGACNLIAGNKYGVLLSGSGALTNTVQGNFIGTNRTGTAALGNAEVGVVVTDGASDNLIGGAWETMRNLISGNGTGAGTTAAATTLYGGVVVNGSSSTGNTVQGNYIGVRADGVSVLPNQGDGVWLYQAANNTVADNVISGNQDNGVEVVGSAATGNRIQGNLIGTDKDGTIAVANGGAGVFLNGASGNRVGGTEAGQGNIIAGNDGSGVKISGSGADNNVVQGNTIGIRGDLAGSLPNDGDGVFIGEGAKDNQVGGTEEGAENFIGGNGSDGVEINGTDTTGNAVQGNAIGTLGDGVTRIGNRGHGVHLAAGAGQNTVGGVITATANLIAFNGGDGVYVAAGSGNTIRHNAVYTNAGLGIDLGTGGVTPNDAGDADGGANGLQNFPLLTSLVISNGVATVEGVLNSTAATSYTLEFFANAACDPSLHGEGQRYLGAITVTTNTGGDAAFTFTAPLSETEKVAATATDPNGNTSEFSRCVRRTERRVVDPTVGASVVLTDTQGNRTVIEIPTGAVTYTQPITLAYALIEDAVGAPTGFASGNHAFELSAYLGHTPLFGLRFSPPITVTIHYSDADVAGMQEDALTLRYWDGSAWSDDGIGVVERDTDANYVVFTVAHLSDFALFGRVYDIYLPLVLRNR